MLAYFLAALHAQPSLLPATVTALGVLFGACQFFLTTRRDRQRRTLEICERFILEPETAERWERLLVALRRNEFPLDTAPGTAASLRRDVSRLLNHLETICTGVNRGFYGKRVVRSYLETHAEFLYRHFLRQDPPPLTSSRYYASEFVEFRRAFGKPDFVEQSPQTAAAALARSLTEAAGSAELGTALRREARLTERLRFLLREERRLSRRPAP